MITTMIMRWYKAMTCAEIRKKAKAWEEITGHPPVMQIRGIWKDCQGGPCCQVSLAPSVFPDKFWTVRSVGPHWVEIILSDGEPEFVRPEAGELVEVLFTCPK